jgi:hypothetical protein
MIHLALYSTHTIPNPPLAKKGIQSEAAGAGQRDDRSPARPCLSAPQGYAGAGLARRLIGASCAKQRITPGQLITHADRGASMRSKSLA